jgi:hypothetical protein
MQRRTAAFTTLFTAASVPTKNGMNIGSFESEVLKDS